MGKIDIIRISDEVFTHKGFDEKGCYGSNCADACCKRGADVDKDSYDLIMQFRGEIQQRLGRDLDLCFEQTWSNQTDFLGNNSISSAVINGTCALHLSHGRGCVLFQMVTEGICPITTIPSTCRLYPLTWNNMTIELVKDIEKSCNCLTSGECNTRKLWDTQHAAIEDIFSITH